MPCACSFATVSGDRSTLPITSFSRRTMSGETFAGVCTPYMMVAS